MKTNKDMKLSVLESAANLEMDSTGNFVGDQEVSSWRLMSLDRSDVLKPIYLAGPTYR